MVKDVNKYHEVADGRGANRNKEIDVLCCPIYDLLCVHLTGNQTSVDSKSLAYNSNNLVKLYFCAHDNVTHL